MLSGMDILGQVSVMAAIVAGILILTFGIIGIAELVSRAVER